jgi:V/A-type H+/Na+-transporting ATPase subunit F
MSAPGPTTTRTSAGPAHPLRLAVAVRPGDAGGFRLAGAEVREVAPGEETAAFRELLGDPRVGVLAVEEALLGAAPPHLLTRARERGLPVVLPFALPRRWGETSGARSATACGWGRAARAPAAGGRAADERPDRPPGRPHRDRQRPGRRWPQ